MLLAFNVLEDVNQRVIAKLGLIKWGVVGEKEHRLCRVCKVSLSLNVNTVKAKELVKT